MQILNIKNLQEWLLILIYHCRSISTSNCELSEYTNSGDYNAHKRGLTKHCYSMPHQPGFMYGAPAEFVNLSLIMPTTKSVSQKWWEDQMDAKCLEESLVRAGLVHSFATANAVAHYQGRVVC